MDLEGKVVIVTGSSTGIGQAVAEAFARRGSKVVVNSKTSADEGKRVADALSANGDATYIQADVSDETQARELIGRVVDKFGTVNVLVNNAGRTEPMPFIESTNYHWLEMLRTNLMSTVLCSREAAQVMLRAGTGVIINTSSVRGLDPNGREGVMAYSAAKAAVNNFTRTLAKELAPTVRVNAIAPGFVATSYMDRAEPELKQSWLENIPLGRFIEPAEIADAYIHLATNDVVTGSIFTVDAGFTLHPA